MHACANHQYSQQPIAGRILVSLTDEEISYGVLFSHKQERISNSHRLLNITCSIKESSQEGPHIQLHLHEKQEQLI